MSRVLKLSPKGAAAQDAPPSKSLQSKIAALPRSDEFLSLTDVWQRTGALASQQSGGSPKRAQPAIRDERELARRQAEEIVKQAQAEAARIEQEARDKGFAEGEAKGQAEGKARYDAQVQQLGALLGILQEQRGEVLRRYEQELFTLVKTMVDRLVYHEASVNPLVIQGCLQNAMGMVVENSLVKVHLHPEDMHRIKEISLENPAFFEGKSRVQLVEDPAVSQGGCLLKTSFGEIDATLENCKEKLYEAVDRAFMAALAADAAGGGNPPPAA